MDVQGTQKGTERIRGVGDKSGKEFGRISEKKLLGCLDAVLKKIV